MKLLFSKALSHQPAKKWCDKCDNVMAENTAQSVYYIFRDYLIILTLPHPPPDYRWGGHATLSKNGEGGVSIRHGGQVF